jgi:hypothetical protein
MNDETHVWEKQIVLLLTLQNLKLSMGATWLSPLVCGSSHSSASVT